MFEDDDEPQASAGVGAPERTASESRAAAAVVATAGRHLPPVVDCSRLLLVMLLCKCLVSFVY